MRGRKRKFPSNFQVPSWTSSDEDLHLRDDTAEPNEGQEQRAGQQQLLVTESPGSGQDPRQSHDRLAVQESHGADSEVDVHMEQHGERNFVLDISGEITKQGDDNSVDHHHPDSPSDDNPGLPDEESNVADYEDDVQRDHLVQVIRGESNLPAEDDNSGYHHPDSPTDNDDEPGLPHDEQGYPANGQIDDDVEDHERNFDHLEEEVPRNPEGNCNFLFTLFLFFFFSSFCLSFRLVTLPIDIDN